MTTPEEPTIHLNNHAEQHASAAAMGRRGGNGKKIGAIKSRLDSLVFAELTEDQLVHLTDILADTVRELHAELQSRKISTPGRSLTVDGLRTNILALDATQVTTVDALISLAIAGTDWDHAASKAMFLRNFRTELEI